MLIGHVPAGYLLTRAILSRRRSRDGDARRLMALGLIASVLPDLDLPYFHFVDHHRHVHHAYLTHTPLAVAIAAAIVALAMVMAGRWRAHRTAYVVVTANVLAHLVLDTLAGGIRWMWPWSDAEFAVATVPAVHRAWMLNFVLHWTFAVELALVIAALAVWMRSRSASAERAAARAHLPGMAGWR
jgi:inner membrane protein